MPNVMYPNVMYTKKSRHYAEGTFPSKVVSVESIKTEEKDHFRFFHATKKGLITVIFPYDGSCIHEDSALYMYIKTLLGKEPPAEVKLDDLIGRHCYLDIENDVNYLGYLYSYVTAQYPMFTSEEHRNEFYDNNDFEHVYGAGYDYEDFIENCIKDLQSEDYFQPTEEDFINYCDYELQD